MEDKVKEKKEKLMKELTDMQKKLVKIMTDIAQLSAKIKEKKEDEKNE